MKLYGYWRSTAAYRVRIALNLKGVRYDTVAVDLSRGDQNRGDYAGLNPARLVPALVLENGTVLTQSLAIIDWLEGQYPNPALVPDDPLRRARVLAMAQVIASDIHPINNLRVMQELEQRFRATAAQRAEWMRHWMRLGLDLLEREVDPATPFAFTDTPTLADICLVAQLYNARRWEMDLRPYPTLLKIDAAAAQIPAFRDAAPKAQPDSTLD